MYIVNLSITGRCNLKCPCCYQTKRPIDMGWDTLQKVINGCSEMDTQVLMITGGEPLLHKDLDRVIYLADSKNILTYISSNGVGIKPERIELLRQAGLTGLCLSLEVADISGKAGHDRVGFAESFNAIPLLVSADIEFFVNMIVTAYNIWHLESTVQRLQNMGVKKITLLRPKPSLDAKWFVRSRLNRSHLFQLQQIKIHLDKYPALETVNIDCALGMLYSCYTPEQLEAAGINPCLAGTRYISIDCNADVYPCSNLQYAEFFAGNAKQQSLSDIVLNSGVLKELRSLSLNGSCGTCMISQYCGGCRAIAYYDDKSISAADKDCFYF